MAVDEGCLEQDKGYTADHSKFVGLAGTFLSRPPQGRARGVMNQKFAKPLLVLNPHAISASFRGEKPGEPTALSAGSKNNIS